MLNFLNIRGQGVDFQIFFKFFLKIEPPSPRGVGVKFTEYSWTINSWDASLPYFSSTNLMEFVLLERRKIELEIYLPKILNLQPWTIWNLKKKSKKKSDQTALMNRQKETKSVKRWEKVMIQVVLLPRWPRRILKSSKPLNWIYQS